MVLLVNALNELRILLQSGYEFVTEQRLENQFHFL